MCIGLMMQVKNREDKLINKVEDNKQIKSGTVLKNKRISSLEIKNNLKFDMQNKDNGNNTYEINNGDIEYEMMSEEYNKYSKNKAITNNK